MFKKVVIEKQGGEEGKKGIYGRSEKGGGGLKRLGREEGYE